MRCRQIRGNSEDFGGLGVIAFADFGQLPPVMDRPLWSIPIKGCGLGTDGASMFKKFEETINLLKQVRQSDPGAAEFRQLLLRLRNGIPTRDDVKTLNTRFVNVLGPKALEDFQHGVRIFCTNAECGSFNRFVPLTFFITSQIRIFL